MTTFNILLIITTIMTNYYLEFLDRNHHTNADIIMAIYNDYYEQEHTCEIYFNNLNKIKIMVPQNISM